MRRFIRISLLGALLATPAYSAETVDVPDGLAEAHGAVLRGLDKVAGESQDIDIQVGQTVDFGFITVSLQDCRYPADDPASNAYAHLEITDRNKQKIVFSGWMIAGSPALSALDHQRYDVWVMRCSNS